MQHFRAFIFDLYGVILDSFREGLERIRMLCAAAEIPFDRKTRQRLTKLWGLPGVPLLKQGLLLSSDEFVEGLYKKWERMDQSRPPRLVLGARETLFWLRQNKFKKAVLTSRNKMNTKEVLRRHDLLREFRIVTAREDVHHRKPDPRALRPTLELFKDKFGITASECVFVGDTRTDVECGVAANLTTLVVQTGPYLLRHEKNASNLPIPIGNVLGSINELPLWIEENYGGDLAVPSMKPPCTSGCVAAFF